MRLTFQVRFHTHPGQSIWLTGDHEILGNQDLSRALPLRYVDEQTWEAIVLLPRSCAPDQEITYNYLLRNADGTLLLGWGKDKQLNPAALAQDRITIVDAWNSPAFFENAFYTEPFQEVLLKSNFTEIPRNWPEQFSHIFKVKAPLLKAGETLCLVGDVSALKQWDVTTPILLSRGNNEQFFSTALDLSQSTFPVFYKYGVFDVNAGHFVRYEEGANRVLPAMPSGLPFRPTDVPQPTARPEQSETLNQLTLVNDGFARLPNAAWKGAGVAIPVFSLRSERSFGVGEFADLKLLVDWCKNTGLQLIQILPVNDTIATNTWADSYPYAAISAFALHPLYLNLEAVAEGANRKLVNDLEPRRRELNALEAVDYEAVLHTKMQVLRQIFPAQKEKTFKRKAYWEFFEQNEAWLVPYAAFSVLRDQYGTAHFNEWPEHRAFVPDDLRILTQENGSFRESIEFYYWVQFHLHLQLREAAEYAHANGVILKGDIAIGVSRYGADAWQEPSLYHMDMQAGAPPDPFAAKGQNWGFPTYNWERMRETGFAWWKRRFEQMGRYFDAFRIDHILGFFRIWSIPMDAVEGILGHFVPALPVRAGEFAARGIQFDRQRFLKPFITDRLLDEIFGPEAEFIRHQFLDAERHGGYSLKPQYETQRQVEQQFAEWEKSEKNDRLKIGLFDLISNVLLLEVEGSQGQEFHFRLGMDTTASFKALDRDTQHQLKDLYIDYFYRRQDEFWRQKAMEKLPALKQVTNMLICGEDLGMVPACVPDVMKQLGLLCLEIQRMPKELNREFSRPEDAPYLSVVMPSTHDMSTIRGWWEEDPGLTQKFYNSELQMPGDAPRTCTPEVAELIIQQHLNSPAMWSIFQLQDLLAMDGTLRRSDAKAERINVPAIPNYYWRYRMHFELELLTGNQKSDPRARAAEVFNQQLQAMLVANDRART